MLVFMSFSQAFAQDKVEPNVGAELVSQYVWRGQKLAVVSVKCKTLRYEGLTIRLICFDSKGYEMCYHYRYNARSVRPVCAPQKK